MNSTHKKKIVENIFSLWFVQAINCVMPLLVLPYLTRVLGLENFGIYILAQALALYFQVFTDYGFQYTATQKIALHRENPKKVAEIFSSVIQIKFGLMLIGFVLFSAIVFLFPLFSKASAIYLISYVHVVGTVFLPLWFFQGMEEMKLITLFHFVGRATTTVLIFLLVSGADDLFLAVLLTALSFPISALSGMYFIHRRYGLRFKWKVDTESAKEHLKDGGNAFIATCSGNIYGQGAPLIVGAIVGEVAAGFYGLAQKILMTISSLVQPVVQGLYPHLCKKYEEQPAGFYILKRQVLTGVSVVGVLCSVGLYVLSPQVAWVLTGESQPILVSLVRIFAFIVLLDQLNIVMTGFILAKQRFADIRKIYIRAGAAFLLVSIPATFWFGVWGMAFTMLFVVEVLVLFFSFRILREPQDLHQGAAA